MFWAEYPRDVIRVSGADASAYLHGQLSNDLRDMAVGESRWAMLLEPTGKIVVLLRVWRCADEEFVLDTDAGFGEMMIARLARFKIRVKVDIEPLPWRCIAVRGAAADGLATWGIGDELPASDVLGADPVAPEGVPAGSADDLLAARIVATWPAMGCEIMPGATIPAETGITDVAVSFTKGCYPGQELVERMDSRGSSAPRLLQTVAVDRGAVAGDAYLIDGIDAGTLTSVRGTAALALVKRSALSR